jgi:hypothetical protein
MHDNLTHAAIQQGCDRANREKRTMGVWRSGATLYVRPVEGPADDFVEPLPADAAKLGTCVPLREILGERD